MTQRILHLMLVLAITLSLAACTPIQEPMTISVGENSSAPPITSVEEAEKAEKAEEVLPGMTPEDAEKAILTGLEEIFTASENGPTMRYHADPGSGSSPWNNIDIELLPRVQALFAACNWADAGAEYTEEMEEKERAAIELYEEEFVEGAAFLLTLHDIAASTDFLMYRGQPYINMYGRYYETEDYTQLYLALEQLWYEYNGDAINAHVQGVMEEHFAGKNIIARVERGGEAQAQAECVWFEVSTQVKALLAESQWISVPTWYNKPQAGAGRLVLSDGQGYEVTIHESRPFLSAYGFHYKSVDEDGEEKPLFDAMCDILGLAG